MHITFFLNIQLAQLTDDIYGKQSQIYAMSILMLTTGDKPLSLSVLAVLGFGKLLKWLLLLLYSPLTLLHTLLS